MFGASNKSHPAESRSAHSLARIAHAVTEFEARDCEILTRELILNLHEEETISGLDAENLRILSKVALEKRLFEIANF
jgi:hypothetical protein